VHRLWDDRPAKPKPGGTKGHDDDAMGLTASISFAIKVINTGHFR